MGIRLTDITKLTLYSVDDPIRGSLCVAEYENHIPFQIKRIFYLYNLTEGQMRGQHAHREQDQFLICVSGSAEIHAIRRGQESKFTLDRPNEGIYLPPLTWVDIKILEKNTVCLVIASDYYNEEDYIRRYKDFTQLIADT